jgi:hypothetical protein
MNTKPDELGCANVEGKHPNDANSEQRQESKRNGVMLHRGSKLESEAPNKERLGIVRT